MYNAKVNFITEPNICIIAPVYNTQDYLHRCAQSSQNQTFSNFQLILVDDGLTDKRGKICDSLALEKLKIYVIYKKNGGIASARNVGIT